METQVVNIELNQFNELLNSIHNNSQLSQDIISRLDNITQGFQIVLYILIAFLAWKVINVMYKLFGGIFFGGI